MMCCGYTHSSKISTSPWLAEQLQESTQATHLHLPHHSPIPLVNNSHTHSLGSRPTDVLLDLPPRARRPLGLFLLKQASARSSAQPITCAIVHLGEAIEAKLPLISTDKAHGALQHFLFHSRRWLGALRWPLALFIFDCS